MLYKTLNVKSLALIIILRILYSPSVKQKIKTLLQTHSVFLSFLRFQRADTVTVQDGNVFLLHD